MTTPPDASGERNWVLHEPTWVGDEEDPERATGPWAGHRWFGYDLVRWARPGRIVELGTHYGVSFFALVQALRDGQLDGEAHAIDTWKGDPHAGFYEGVFEHVEGIVQRRFADVDVHLHRCTFDEALDRFDDASVDLLHIDGYHSYEAAQHDLDTWLPKLAPNGIVLMHDVAPDSGYGSTQHWEEDVATRYPSFRFHHYFGLGVAFPKGIEGREYLLTDEFGRWRRYYEHRAMRRLGEQQQRDLSRMVDDRDEALAVSQRLVEERDEALRRTEAMVAARDETIRAQTALVDERDAALRDAAALLEDREEAIAAQTRLIDERDAALREAADRIVERDAATARERRHIEELEERVDELQWQRDEERAVRDRLVTELRLIEGSVPLAVPAQDQAAQPEPPEGLDDADRAATPGRLDAFADALPDSAAELLRQGQRRWWSLRDYLRWRGETRRRAAAIEPYVDPQAMGASSASRVSRWYLRRGAARGVDPHPGFSSRFYARFTGVPSQAGPFHHYITVGLAEGLPGSPAGLRRLVRNPFAAGQEALEWIGWLRSPDEPEHALRSSAEVPLDGVDLLTFDVWDTLIERTRPPESAKLSSAAWLVSQPEVSGIDRWELYRARVEAEATLARERRTALGFGEYAASEAVHAALSRVLPELDDEGLAALVTRAVTFEVQDESAHTRPRREWVHLLRRARDSGVRVVIVSDFYLHADQLRAVLASCGVEADDLDVLVSVDTGVSKAAGGKLLERARGDLPAARHLHVGDSEPADVRPQLDAGGKVVHVARSPLTTSFPSGVLDAERVARSATPLLRALRPGADRAGGRLPSSADELRARWSAIRRDAGAELAAVAVSVVWAASQRAMELDTRRVVYVSREGATLAAIHAAVAPELGLDHVDAVHLPLSRRLTFGPAVADDLIAGLSRLWEVYRGQSVAELLGSLGLRASDVAGELQSRGVAPSDLVTPDQALELLTHGRLGDRVRRHLLVQRGRAREYLARTLGGAEVVVAADVGWRGSIQDNLARLEPDRLFHGTYAALLPFTSRQLANVGKFAVGPDANLGHDVAWLEHRVAVVERLLSADLPPSDRFGRDEDARVTITYGAATPPSSGLLDVRSGAIAAAPTVAAVLRTTGLGPYDTRGLVEETLRVILDAPPPALADVVLGTAQVEDFGALATHGALDRLSVAAQVLADVAEGREPGPPSSSWPAGARALPAYVSAASTFGAGA